MGVVEMRRLVVVVACVIGLLWVAPVPGAGPAPAPAAAVGLEAGVAISSASPSHRNHSGTR
jgi:hypothetical protein